MGAIPIVIVTYGGSQIFIHCFSFICTVNTSLLSHIYMGMPKHWECVEEKYREQLGL